MKLTFTTPAGDMVTLDLADDMELENVKALCEDDLRIPAAKMDVSANGQRFTDDKKTLVTLGLKDGDVVLIKNTSVNSSSGRSGPAPCKIPKIDFSSIVVPGAASQPSSSRQTAVPAELSAQDLSYAKQFVERARHNIELDPESMEKMTTESPQLLDAVMKNDYANVINVLKKEHIKTQQENARKMQILYENPDSLEAQQLIHEQIRAQAIQENYEYAVEHTPESMAQVHMLYVNCSVNGHQMKAFVDSGAQISIISKEYAEKCGIAHLVDERIQGIAQGVGTQRFIGKIHACQMAIGGAHLTTSFSVLPEGNMQILLGLDMMRRHQMVIDLRRNVLIVGTTNTETSFLAESEIPTGSMGKDREMAFIPNELDILALVGMGFTREQAREALIKFEGNKDHAVSDLLSKQAAAAKPSESNRK